LFYSRSPAPPSSSSKRTQPKTPIDRGFACFRSNQLSGLEQRDNKATAVRPICAPNRVPQEHEASATIKDSQAVWSNATRKKPANLPGRSWRELPFPPWQVILPPNNTATKAPEAQLPKEHLEPRGSETTVSLKPGGPSLLLLSRRSGLSSPCQTEML
jgi:hypothetical protein